MHDVHAYAVGAPLERGDPRELGRAPPSTPSSAAAPGPGAGTFFEPTTTTRPPLGASLSRGWHRAAARDWRPVDRHGVSATRRRQGCRSRAAGKTPAFSTSMSIPPKRRHRPRARVPPPCAEVTSHASPEEVRAYGASTRRVAVQADHRGAAREERFNARLADARRPRRSPAPPRPRTTALSRLSCSFACSRSQYSTSKMSFAGKRAITAERFGALDHLDRMGVDLARSPRPSRCGRPRQTPARDRATIARRRIEHRFRSRARLRRIGARSSRVRLRIGRHVRPSMGTRLVRMT